MSSKISLPVLAMIGLVAGALGLFAFFFMTGDNTTWVYEKTIIPGTDHYVGSFAKGLVYNGIGLVDHSTINTTELCEASNLGMKIKIYPCKVRNFPNQNITHNVEFTWTGGSAINTTWIFVYEGNVTNFGMKLGHPVNLSAQMGTKEQFISNYLVSGVINFTNLGTPQQSVCQLGTANNTLMYDVWQANATSQYHNVYCFNNSITINATAFRVNGNATVPNVVTIPTVSYTDGTVPIQYLGYGLLNDSNSYYRVQQATFQPNQTYYTQWKFGAPNGADRGKWHIVGYQTETGLNNAITLGQYIYVDPSWNSTLNDGLRMYYDFNSSRELVFGVVNLTANEGAPVFNATSCLIGLCGQTWEGNNFRINPNATNGINYSSLNMTINFWVRGIDNGASGNPYFYGSLSNGINQLGWDTPTAVLASASWTGTGGDLAGGNTGAGTYFMMTIVYNAFNTTTANVSIYRDGVIRRSGTGSAVNTGLGSIDTILGNIFNNVFDWHGQFDEFGMWNRTLSQSEVTQLYNGGSGITYTPEGASSPAGGVSALLITPANRTVTGASSLNFSVNTTTTGSFNHTNTTIKVFNTTGLFYTNITTFANGLNGTKVISWNVTNLLNGTYVWNAYPCGFNGTATNCSIASNGNYTLTVDTDPPVISDLNFNISSRVVAGFPAQINLSFNASDPNLQNCFYNTDENPNFTLYTCNTTVAVNFTQWGKKGIMWGANDSVGGRTTNFSNFTLGVWSVFESADPISEGGSAVFNLTINYTDIAGSSAYLTWNNTKFTPDSQVSTQNQTVFGYRLVAPNGSGSSAGAVNFWNWTFNVTGGAINNVTSNFNQTVYSVSMSDCSAGGRTILNFTQFYEGNRTRFAISNVSSNNLQVDVRLTSLIDPTVSFRYNNTKVNTPFISVCVPNEVLNSTSYKLDMTGSYTGTNSVQEFFYIDNGTVSFTNTPQNYSWYDLLTADSTTFLFTFLDENGLEVPNIIVETYRYYIGDGQFIEVERSKEDNNGETHIHLVEEDVIYRFRITFQNQEIFLSDQYNAKCLSSPCSITLSAEPDNPQFPTVYNNLPEGSYRVEANRTSRQVTLFFNLNQTETMNLTVFTSDNNAVQAVASGTTTGSSGQVSVIVPLQYGNATYSAVIYMGSQFVATRVVDLSESANDYFGSLGLFLGALAVLCLALIGASQGEWIVIWTVLGLITVSTMFLVDLQWYALMTFVAGAGIFLIKLVARRRV